MQNTRTCSICVEDTAFFGIGKCNHKNICAQCHFKMRSKGDLKCSFCKEENTLMIITSDLKKTFDSFDRSSLLEFQDCNTIFADSSSTLEALVELTSVRCPVESCNSKPFPNLIFYKKHLKDKHRSFVWYPTRLSNP